MTRAIAVEKDAERDLERRKGDEVCAREKPELGGPEAKRGGHLRTDDRIHRAVEEAQEVPEAERKQDAAETGDCAHRIGTDHGSRSLVFWARIQGELTAAVSRSATEVVGSH